MKTPKTPYSFVVLRYMHDVFTREFVNVGVLLHAPRARFLGFEKLPTLERVKGLFPGAHSDSLRDLLSFLASRTEEIQRQTSQLLDRDMQSAESIAKTLLPPDDSALQWSAAGGGATDNPQASLRALFERLVERHLKAHAPTRKDDVDVWKPFEREFRRRDVLQRFQEKTLTVGKLTHRFENVWQPPGSYLRLFQPLSFDLIDPSKIVQKAINWNGLLRQLRKANSDFYAYLLVGAPTDKDRQDAFEQAYETLDEGGDRKQLVREGEASSFTAGMEKEIKATGNN